MSQWSDFSATLGTRVGLDLRDAQQLHAFSISHAAEFWSHLLSWAPLQFDGDPSCVRLGTNVETARFFPDLRLNYAENLLASSATRLDDAPAIVSHRADGSLTRLSRGELRTLVERLASALKASGVGEGDTVAAILRNDAEAAIVALATAAVGARLAIEAPETGSQAIAVRFAPLHPRVLMAHAKPAAHDTGVPLAQRVADVASALGSIEQLVIVDDAAETLPPGRLVPHKLSAFADGRGMPFTWRRFAFDHPLFVTTAASPDELPQGLVHGAGGVLLEQVKEHRLHVDLRPFDTLFVQTSCAWMMWPWQLSALATGCTIVLYDGPIGNANVLWKIVEEERVTVFGISPPYMRLCEHVGLSPGTEFDLSALRAMLSFGPTLYEPAYEWVRSHVKPLPLQALCASPDTLACFYLGHPALPVHAGVCQAASLGLDVQAAPPREGQPFGELVCASPFPSRPLGLASDDHGSRFHAAFFTRHPGAWAEGELIATTPEGGARLHGRADAVMSVRGIRVSPSEVYTVLREFPQIRDAIVVQQRSAQAFSEGRAVLLLVMAPGTSLDGSLTAQLRRRLAEAASAAHVPDVVLQVDELPRTPDGQVARLAVSDAVNGLLPRDIESLIDAGSLEAVRNAPALRGPDLLSEPLPVPPAPSWRSRREHENYLRILWQQTFGFAPIALDDDFFELGGHSLLAARMFTDIQRATGQELALTTLLQAPTIRQLAAVIDAAAWEVPVPLVQLRAGTGRPVFLAHSLAGNFLELWAVLRAIDKVTRPIYGLQARVLAAGEQPRLSVGGMADDYIEHMRKVQPVGPYTIGGYSFGGLIAYEIAQRLHRAGETVDVLGLIDTHVHGRHLPPRQWLKYRARRVAEAWKRMRSLPLREGLSYAKKKVLVLLDRLRGTLGMKLAHPHLVGDLIREENMPPALRRLRGAMLYALREYRPEPYPGSAVFLRAAEVGNDDPLPLWRKVVLGGVEVSVTPGTHDEMVVGANAKELARALARHL